MPGRWREAVQIRRECQTDGSGVLLERPAAERDRIPADVSYECWAAPLRVWSAAKLVSDHFRILTRDQHLYQLVVVVQPKLPLSGLRLHGETVELLHHPVELYHLPPGVFHGHQRRLLLVRIQHRQLLW